MLSLYSRPELCADSPLYAFTDNGCSANVDTDYEPDNTDDYGYGTLTTTVRYLTCSNGMCELRADARTEVFTGDDFDYGAPGPAVAPAGFDAGAEAPGIDREVPDMGAGMGAAPGPVEAGGSADPAGDGGYGAVDTAPSGAYGGA